MTLTNNELKHRRVLLEAFVGDVAVVAARVGASFAEQRMFCRRQQALALRLVPPTMHGPLIAPHVAISIPWSPKNRNGPAQLKI